MTKNSKSRFERAGLADQQAKPKYSLLKARQKLEAFCAYQERCDQEIRLKCRSWSMNTKQTEILISELESKNFINEERFARAFASGKFRIKKWGRNKIRMHLKKKAISEYFIKAGMGEIDEEEYLKTILDLIAKKDKLLKEKDKWKRRQKIQRYLSSKGYEMNLVREAMD